jgi:transposase
MPYRAISADLKQRALWLLANGYVPDEVWTILNTSTRSIQRWANNMDTHGHVLPPLNPLQGRQHSLNSIHIYGLIAVIQASPAMYLDELQDWLALEHDVLISKTALHNNIQAAGLTYKLLRRRAAERDELAREQWREDVRVNFVATQMVWMDESSKDDRTIYRHYGRAATGERAVIDTQFVRGQRYSILPAMTIDGYIATRIISRSVEGEEFFDFIVEDVVCGHALASPAVNHGPTVSLAPAHESLPWRPQHPYSGQLRYPQEPVIAGGR